MPTQLANNLRRLMARFNLTLPEVVQRTGLDERTIKGILRGTLKPHARTLHRLANGLNVDCDELFQHPSALAFRLFDRKTNPAVDELIAAQPSLFRNWSEADYEVLYSHFGSGGALTTAGTLQMVHRLNRQRELQRKVALLLETNEAEHLAELVELLYQRILVKQSVFSSR